jgi:O-antigen ligase
LVIVLVSLINYDLLVLATFCLIGFVRFEPAPFDVLLIVLLGMGLLTGRLRWPSSKEGATVQIGLWGLTLTNVLSTVGVVPIYHSLRFLSITLYLLVLFCFVRMYTTEPRAMRMVLVGYLVSAAVNGLAAILSFLGISMPISVVYYSIRGIGFFKDPNVYGAFVVLAPLWCADQAIRRPPSLIRTMPLLLLVGLLGIAAMLSQSRAVWVNLAFSGLVYLLLLLRRGSLIHIVRFFVLAMAALLTAILVLRFLGLGDVFIRRSQSHGYDESRFNIQGRGALAGLSHPIGVGPGGWPNAHSLYVRTLAEHGILGLAALGLLIGGLVVPLTQRTLREPIKNQVLPDPVVLAWIGGQLVNSLVIDSIHWRHLWTVLGLAWASLEWSREEK